MKVLTAGSGPRVPESLRPAPVPRLGLGAASGPGTALPVATPGEGVCYAGLAPGPSTGAGRIPFDADHMREDHLAELVLHVAQRQAGEDGLAEIPEPGHDRRGGDPGERLDDILRITGDSHRLGGRGRWLRVRRSVRLLPLLRDRVRRGDRARAGLGSGGDARAPRTWRGRPSVRPFTPGPSSSALTWPADVAADSANGCHPSIWQDQLGGLVLLPHLVGHVLGRPVLDLPRQV